MKQYIYSRVSTNDQSIAAQAELLAKAYPDAQLHKEVGSGSTVEGREVLNSLMDALGKGDALIVYDISRLARNTTDFLKLLEQIEEVGASLIIHNLGGSSVDSATPTGKMLLTIMSAVVAMERETILEKTRVGVARAKAAGKYKGKQANPETVKACERAMAMVKLGVSKAKAAKAEGIGIATLYRHIKVSEG